MHLCRWWYGHRRASPALLCHQWLSSVDGVLHRYRQSKTHLPLGSWPLGIWPRSREYMNNTKWTFFFCEGDGFWGGEEHEKTGRWVWSGRTHDVRFPNNWSKKSFLKTLCIWKEHGVLWAGCSKELVYCVKVFVPSNIFYLCISLHCGDWGNKHSFVCRQLIAPLRSDQFCFIYIYGITLNA